MEKSQTPTRRRRSGPSYERLGERIREALVFFGGEAHRRDVIAQVARELGMDVRNIPEELEVAAIKSFEDAWRDEKRRSALGFTLRFGEGSHRWGVRMPELAH
jgi:hypothetical protein